MKEVEGIDEAALLEAIVDELDGREWTPDTLDRIAEMLRGAGYEIRDPDASTGEKSFLFIGERRSPTAIQKGWTWESGRLAAKQLFDALKCCGVAPEDCLFANWFERSGPATVRRIIAKNPKIKVIAMGLKVARALNHEPIVYTGMVHPAARGSIRKKGVYAGHVRETLFGINNLK